MRAFACLGTCASAAIATALLAGLGCDNDSRTTTEFSARNGSASTGNRSTSYPTLAGATLPAHQPAKPDENEKTDPGKSSGVVFAKRGPAKPDENEKNEPAPSTKLPEPEGGWTRSNALGDNVWLETRDKKRRVVVGTTVCLREGEYGLECLLCRQHTKEHESILATTAHAKLIHAALLLAGAEPGKPVTFEPEFKPPSGSRIKILVQYEDKGKVLTLPVQQWVWDVKTKKDLDSDWVFAGSYLYPNPDGDDKPRAYAADDDGSYICISNVSNAMLDLPIHSPRGLEERTFGIHTDCVPPIGTKVAIILQPVAK